jgi:hypothetical protein
MSEGPLASFCLFAALHISFFLLHKFEHFWAEEYFKYIPGRTVLSYIHILFIPGRPKNAGFLTI